MTNEAAILSGGVRAEPGMRVYNQKLGMWVFLASEVMFFTGLIGAYVILRFGAGVTLEHRMIHLLQERDRVVPAGLPQLGV